MERLVEGWGESVCNAVAGFASTSLRCAEMEVMQFTGYGALGLIAALAMLGAMTLLHR
jgi:hypothetical protein